MYAPVGMGGFFSIVGKVLKTGAAVASGNPVAIAGAVGSDIPHGKGGAKPVNYGKTPNNSVATLDNANLALFGVGALTVVLVIAKHHRRRY